MDRLFFSLLTLALQWFRPRYNAYLQLLQAQIQILRSRIDVSRIVPTPQEKAELLRLGALVEVRQRVLIQLRYHYVRV